MKKIYQTPAIKTMDMDEAEALMEIGSVYPYNDENSVSTIESGTDNTINSSDDGYNWNNAKTSVWE